MYVKVISDEKSMAQVGGIFALNEPLKSGALYKAAFENKYYTRVFFYIDEEEYDIVVHNRHLKILDLDEARDFKLNKLGI